MGRRKKSPDEKLVTMTTNLPPALCDEIIQKAGARQMSPSALVREVLVDAFRDCNMTAPSPSA